LAPITVGTAIWPAHALPEQGVIDKLPPQVVLCIRKDSTLYFPGYPDMAHSMFTKKLLALTMCATVLAMVPEMTLARTETGGSKHIGKHKRTHRSRVMRAPWPVQAWPDNQAWPNSQPRGQPRTCFRAIDCAKWPPPIDEDPDRKVSGEGV
jgi:hypothetical protein